MQRARMPDPVVDGGQTDDGWRVNRRDKRADSLAGAKSPGDDHAPLEEKQVAAQPEEMTAATRVHIDDTELAELGACRV